MKLAFATTTTLIVGLSACHAQQEATPEPLFRTTDAALVRAGSTILVPGTNQLPAGVDANAAYAPSRRLDVLVGVGQLTAPERAVLERADGMLKSQPKDGRVTVDELAQLAAPGFVNVLSPAEKAALVTVWRVMRAPAKISAAGLVLPAPVAAFDLAAASVVRTQGSTLVRPAERTRFTVAEAANQVWNGVETVSRIGYAFDDDADPTTVSLSDVDAAIATPAYTPAEIAAFTALRAALVNFARAEADAARDSIPPTLRAEVHGLPLPGVVESSVALPGGAKLAISRSSVLKETRSRPNNWAGALEFTLGCEQSWTYVVSGPTATAFVVVLDPATELDTSSYGEFRGVDPKVEQLEEIWVDGAPTARVVIPVTPALADKRSVDLASFRGHAFFAGEGAAEVKLKTITADVLNYPSPVFRATYHYAPPSAWDLIYEDYTHKKWLHPDVAVPAGNYLLTLPDNRGTMRVVVYPEGAILVSFGQAMKNVPAGTVLAAAAPLASGAFTTTPGEVRAEITANAAMLFETGHPAVGVPLTAENRTAW